MTEKITHRSQAIFSGLRISLLLAILTGLPATLFAQDNADADLTGEVLEVYADDFVNHRADKFYILHDHTSGQLYRLRWTGGEPVDLRTGDRVRVRGKKHGQEVTVPSDGTGVQPVDVTSAAVASQHRTIVIGINFQNANLECSVTDIQTRMFGGGESVTGLYQEMSSGSLLLSGDVVGPFKINYNSSGACDYNAWATAADSAAQAAGVDLSQYSHKVYVFSKVNGCNWAGLGTVGGNPSRAWIATCDLTDVYAHELGHNLGMHHASTDADNNGTADCEYCDNSDIMGYGGVGLRGFNAAHKEQMGWLSANKVQAVVSNGVFYVAPLEAAATTPYPQTLKIVKPGTTTFYYFSYRRPLGYDVYLPASYATKTSVHHYQGSGSAKTYLISTLTDSVVFSDPTTGLTVTQLSHNNDFATLLVSYGCSSAAPSASVTPSAQNVSAGATATFTVSVVNNDSAACSASAFWLTPSVPSGWTVSVLPGSLTLAPGQAGNATLSVTSPASTPDGNYTATLAVSDNFTATHNASATATYSIAGDTTAPSAPANLSATTRKRRVSLGWTVSTDNVGVTGYLIWRDGLNIGQSVTTNFTDRTVLRGVTYSYSVTAKDAAGNQSVPSNPATIVAAGRRH